MFDNIGKDTDQDANKRRAQSFFLSLLVIGSGVGVSVYLSYRVAEVVLEPIFDEEMVEGIIEDAEVDDAAPPPPPPPPPPPAAADASEEEEEEDPDPEEIPDDVKTLDKPVDDEMKNDKKPAGVEGGVEGGVAGGVVGGVIGGVEGGVVGGQLGGGSGPKVFHHSELEVKKRVQPEYPETARSMNLGDQRCMAKVFIDEEGVPYEVIVEKCPNVFHPATKEAILKWRWYPPKDGKNKVKAQTTIGVTYVMK